MKPSDYLLHHTKINYWDNITQEPNKLFPDSEVEHTVGSGLTVYWAKENRKRKSISMKPYVIYF